MDLSDLKPQVRQHVPTPSLGIPRTVVDPGKRVGSASGAEGRRIESCRGHHLSSANIIACNIRATRRSPFGAYADLRSDCCPAGPGTSGEKAHTVESDDDGGSFVPSDAEWKG
jgi:hypothetical protein